MKGRISILLLFCLACICLSTKVYSQHPVGYGSVRSTSQSGTFAFPGLDRAILNEKTAAFYAEEPPKLTFDVLVSASGTVKYVRSPKVGPDYYELRLACTSALYGFTFAAVGDTVGEQWISATLVCEEN